jgi:hypothetical protein
VCMVTLVHIDGWGECVWLHWYTMSKQSGRTLPCLERLHLALAVRALEGDVAGQVHAPPDDGDYEVGHLAVVAQDASESKF